MDGYVVSRVDPAADDVVVLTLEPSGSAAVPAWEPGAHVDLVLGDLVRQYSLCGEPGGPLRVAVLHEPNGRGGSRYVHERLRPGSAVTINGPRNRFPLEVAPAYRFVAGGIGITPLLPMIRRLSVSGADWRLLYGGRRRASMAFVDDLRALDERRVDIRPQDEHGLLPIADFLADAPADTAVYSCGPEPLLDAVGKECASRGLSLRTERFAPRSRPAGVDHGVAAEPDGGAAASAASPGLPAGGGTFEVELARSGTVLTVAAERSLLEVLEGAGVAIDSSCREGTCGTCETGVLGGEPDHRDSLLTEDERAAGDVMFPCVSRACSRRLILDL